MVTNARFSAFMLRLSGMRGLLLVTRPNSQYRSELVTMLRENNIPFEQRIMDTPRTDAYGNDVLPFYLFDIDTGNIYDNLHEIKEFVRGARRAA